RVAESDHRAVGGLVLHGLQRPWIVERVEIVGDGRFLYPLPRRVIPVGQAVDDEVVADRLLQVERFYVDAFDLELQRVLAGRYGEDELTKQRLVADGPADICTKRQPDTACFQFLRLFLFSDNYYFNSLRVL